MPTVDAFPEVPAGQIAIGVTLEGQVRMYSSGWELNLPADGADDASGQLAAAASTARRIIALHRIMPKTCKTEDEKIAWLKDRIKAGQY